MSAQPASTSAGFTLLELLVAIALMAMVLTGISATFQGMMTLYGQVQEQRTSAMQTRLILGLLTDDLRSILVTGGMNNNENHTLSSSMASSLLTPTANTTTSRREFQRVLSFLSGVSVTQRSLGPELTQVFVAYNLRYDDEKESWTLFRTERPYASIVGNWKELTSNLAENVRVFRVRYENASGEIVEGWTRPRLQIEEGQIIPPNYLPKAIHVELILQTRPDLEERYDLRIPLPR